MRNLLIITIATLLLGDFSTKGQQVDFSVPYVGQESGCELQKISKESDYVCLPAVKRNRKGVQWLTNRILATSPDGKEIAYLSLRNNTTNIFIKDADKQGASRQRTNRQSVIDFSYSPDGKEICFAEARGKMNQLYVTDAHNGYVCRQITSGFQDYSPIYSDDKKDIYFTRMESMGGSVWSYNLDHNFLSSYTSGMNPYPANNNKEIYVARVNVDGKGEIWKIVFSTGVEECILSDPERSFFSPVLSPDGSRLLLVGSSKIVNSNMDKSFEYWNTDIYSCNTDGTDLLQHTYHAADDLSPVWSADGKYIYFISQRGNADGLANIWRMTYSNNL